MLQDLDTSDSVFKKIINEPEEVVFTEDEFPVYTEYLERYLD